jgi:hypothetical protein
MLINYFAQSIKKVFQAKTGCNRLKQAKTAYKRDFRDRESIK